jgi:hypothetical protein
MTIWKNTGFINFITAEGIGEWNGHKGFDNAFGYFNEDNDLLMITLISRGLGVLLEIC